MLVFREIDVAAADGPDGLQPQKNATGKTGEGGADQLISLRRGCGGAQYEGGPKKSSGQRQHGRGSSKKRTDGDEEGEATVREQDIDADQPEPAPPSWDGTYGRSCGRRAVWTGMLKMIVEK